MKLRTSPQNAAKFYLWLTTRGGIAHWTSVNLSNPGASWSTPADVTEKPTWQASAKQTIVTDINDIEVETAREVKRFHIAVRRASFSIKVTDGGSRRIRAAVEKAGDGAWYELDHSTQEAVILVPESTVPLAEWIAKNQTTEVTK